MCVREQVRLLKQMGGRFCSVSKVRFVRQEPERTWTPLRRRRGEHGVRVVGTFPVELGYV